MFLGVVLAVAGLFAEGAGMLFLPLLVGVSFVAFAYAFSVIIGYIIILILIASNWRTLLKDI
jgi:Na+(H+)/acetate symporter ActP